MDTKITLKPESSQTELAITVTPSEFKPYLEKAVKQLSKDQPLKGFRPGKAALTVAFEAYGQDRVLHEALDLAMPHFFVQAVLDHDIQAIARPSIAVSTLSVSEGLAFTATVAVLPTVTLGDLSQISVTKRPVVVTDADIDQELKVLAKMRATLLEVARPAETGDTVTIDFKVSMQGTVMEGGESKNHPVHLGEGHFVPDFEQKLQGITAGDEREFTIKFPDDYTKKDLQGKEAHVWVKAHAVQKRVIPELNDDFAKKLGKFTTIKELREQLKQNLVREREQKESDRFQAELSEKVAATATYGPIPDVLIEREIDNRLNEFSQMLAYQQKTVDDYLATHQKTLADIRQEMKPTAEQAVKIGLSLRAAADQEKITITDEEVAAKMQVYLQRYSTPEEAQQDLNMADLKDNISSMIRNQKTLKRLEELVKVSTEPAPKEKV